jgi:dihydrofolate synthase / folylpolyglutamate synthase
LCARSNIASGLRRRLHRSIAGSVEAALRSIAELAYEVPPRILITGSLYLAGPVLALDGTPPA